MEDVGRHRADVTANSSLTEVLDLNTHAFVSTKWANVKVGDFIRIRTRENIPADCVVISVAEKDEQIRGRCFVVCFLYQQIHWWLFGLLRHLLALSWTTCDYFSRIFKIC
jgi:hypothetical protein